MKLKRIDDIPSVSLRHTYGLADDVSVTLKALAAHEITAELDDEVVVLLIETAFSTVTGEQRRLSEAQWRILTLLANADDIWDAQGRWNMSRSVQEYRADVPRRETLYGPS